jgi:hypothetical protein
LRALRIASNVAQSPISRVSNILPITCHRYVDGQRMDPATLTMKTTSYRVQTLVEPFGRFSRCENHGSRWSAWEISPAASGS